MAAAACAMAVIICATVAANDPYPRPIPPAPNRALDIRMINNVFHPDLAKQIISWGFLDNKQLSRRLARNIVTHITHFRWREFATLPLSRRANDFVMQLGYPPRDVEHFLRALAPAFTDAYLDHLRTQFDYFDYTTGISGLASAQLRERAIERWIPVMSRQLAQQICSTSSDAQSWDLPKIKWFDGVLMKDRNRPGRGEGRFRRAIRKMKCFFRRSTVPDASLEKNAYHGNLALWS